MAAVVWDGFHSFIHSFVHYRAPIPFQAQCHVQQLLAVNMREMILALKRDGL